MAREIHIVLKTRAIKVGSCLSLPRLTFQGRGMNAAFTVLELLVVMAIAAVLLAFTMSSIQGLLVNRGISTGIDRISSFLEFSRAEAITKDTYVWVGVQNGQDDGSAQVTLGAVRSLDGTPNLTQNGLCNYKAVTALIAIKGVALTSYPEGVASALSNKLSPFISVNRGIIDLAGNPGSGIRFSIGRREFLDSAQAGTTSSGRIILFTPQGQAMVVSATPPSIVDPYTSITIGLCGAHGATTVYNDPRSGVLLLRGGTGLISIFRL